jgi:tetraacyldisaccharide 4'-kinase
VLRFLLSFVFYVLLKFRELLYHINILKSYKLKKKIISIGNFNFGGSGKTPMTVFLANFLNLSGKEVGVVERAYKGNIKSEEVVLKAKGIDELGFDLSKVGDEPVMLWNSLDAGIKVAVSKRKYKAVINILEKWNFVDYIIIDDGFQHLKLKRDVDLVLMEGDTAFKDKLFPRGTLREPYTGLKRADVLVFTKSNFLNDTEKKQLKQKALNYNKNLKIFFAKAKLLSPQNLEGKKILPVSAIGNPMFFHELLKSHGASFENYFSFKDHYKYSQKDAMDIVRLKDKLNAEYLVCTSKDFVKLSKFIKNSFLIETCYQHDLDDKEGFFKCFL